MKNKTLLYYFAITLSVLDLCFVLTCGFHLFTQIANTRISTPFNQQSLDIHYVLSQASFVLELIAVTIGVIIYPFLSKWRLKLSNPSINGYGY